MVLGALALRFGQPERHNALAAALMGSEAVHVVAHLLLYGSQTALVGWFFGASTRWMVGIPAATALLQELSQTIGRRAFGEGELFDLCVDAVAITVVASAVRLWVRSRGDARG
jgi:hypothetical protein